MIIHNFEKLDIWRLSLDLSIDIFKEFKDSVNYALKNQITRSALSIPSNIAEGSQRNSNPDFIRFLNMAKGSAAELFTQILIAKELEEISKEKSNRYLKKISEISSMINGFINTLSQKPVN